MKIEKNNARKVGQKTLQYLCNRAIKLREAVKQLIKHNLDIDMPISTVGHYLKKMAVHK